MSHLRTITLTTTRSGAVATVVINRGPAGPAGASTFAGLTDKTSADLPAINTPLATALSGKQVTLVSGTNIKTINGTSLLGSGNISVAASSHTHVSADISDASPGGNGAADSGKLFKFGPEGQGVFTSTSGLAIIGSGTGSASTGVEGFSDEGAGVRASSTNGTALYASSDGSGVAIFAASTSGDHANIGFGAFIIANNGNTTLTGTIQASNLSGTNTGDQDLSGYQTKSGVLGLAGFSSITGTIAISNIGGLGTGVGTALAANANESGGFMTRTGMDTRLAQQETYLSFLTASGPACTNSTTLVATGCAVTLPVGNYLIMAELYVDSSVSNNGGNKGQLVKTGSGTAVGNVQAGVFSTTNGTGIDARLAFDASISWATGVPGVVYIIQGHLFVTGDSVTIGWSQAVNSTDAALPVRTPLRGTYIRATRL